MTLADSMTAAVNRIVSRWLKITVPFFVTLCVVFWMFFDTRVMISIAFSTFFPLLAALLVFRFAPVAKVCII
jgi:hypothetical protein